jgi:hypothetical protein
LAVGVGVGTADGVGVASGKGASEIEGWFVTEIVSPRRDVATASQVCALTLGEIEKTQMPSEGPGTHSAASGLRP